MTERILHADKNERVILKSRAMLDRRDFCEKRLPVFKFAPLFYLREKLRPLAFEISVFMSWQVAGVVEFFSRDGGLPFKGVPFPF
jgi:hypothetical protein